MGATASRHRSSSPSLPTKCSLKETRSTTRLFTVPNYTKAVMVPAGSALRFQRPLRLFHHEYRIEVYPAGLDKGTADFVAVFLVRTGPCQRCSKAYRILIEILHGNEQERTVFDNHTARSEETTLAVGGAKGYVRFVKRKELEASGCVRNDMFTIRCTVLVDVWVTRSLAKVMESSFPVDTSSSSTLLSGSHTLMIGSFSKIKAALRAGECVHSTHFSLGGSSWYFKVYPNGHCDDDDNNAVSIFLSRGRSHELATTAEFSFEICGDMEGLGPFTECTFDNNNPEHEFPYYMTRPVDGDDDCLILRCHLRVIRVTMPSLLPNKAEDQPV